MEYEQTRIRIFSASVAKALGFLVPLFLCTQYGTIIDPETRKELMIETGLFCGFVALAFGLWMVTFSERKKLRIDGLDLYFYDSGGTEHQLDLSTTEAELKNGIRKNLEITSKKKTLKLSWLDFGPRAIYRISEYIKISNKT